MTDPHTIGALILGLICAGCLVAYLWWLESQLKAARDQVTRLRAELAKAVDERETLRGIYLRARYGRGRIQ